MVMIKRMPPPFSSDNFSSPLIRRMVNFTYLTILLCLVIYFSARITFTFAAKDYEIPTIERHSGETSVDTEAFSPRIHEGYGETWKMRQLCILLTQIQKPKKSIPMELAAELHEYEKNSIKAFFIEVALADRIMEQYTRNDILSHYLTKQ